MAGKEMDLFDPDAATPEEMESLALQAKVDALPEIVDTATLEMAWEYRKLADALIGKIEEHWKPIKARERAVWMASVEDEKRALEGPTAARAAIQGRIEAWDKRQLAARRVAEARAAEEARQAEQLAREAREQAAAEGKPVPVQMPIVVPAAPVAQAAEVEDLAFSTSYDYVVVNLLDFVKAVAAGKVPVEAVAVVDKVMSSAARVYGPQTNAGKDPGVQYAMPGVPGVAIVAKRTARRK